MRNVRSSLLLLLVALLAALGVWASLTAFERYVLASAPLEPVGILQTSRSVGEREALASPEPEESAEEDSNAVELALHSQLATFGQQHPRQKTTGSATAPSWSVGSAGSNSQADIVGEAAGAPRLSQYRGVVWSHPLQKWKAQYAVQSMDGGGKSRVLDLGYFENEIQAAYSYDEAVRRRGNGHAANHELNFPTIKTGFVADESLLPWRQTCGRVPADQPLRRPGSGQQLSSADCAFMPLARPEPYLSHQLALLTDVVVTLNKTLAATARMPVMLWAGSLLGAYRDGDLIPWTADGDLLIPLGLMEALQKNDGPEVSALFDAGIVTFRTEKTQRFCYHERAPRYAESAGGYCPGSWEACGGGSFISHSAVVTYIDGYAGSIDTSAAAGIGRQVAVQHHKRLGKCVLGDDLRPSQWCRDTARCQNPSMAGIRGTNFVVPANSQKIIVALYGWDWQMKDPQKRGGGGYAGGGGDVCAWPHRPDGRLSEAVRAGAGTVLDEYLPRQGEDGDTVHGEATDAALFASTLGHLAGGAGNNHHGKLRGTSRAIVKEKPPPPTKEQMTSILLG